MRALVALVLVSGCITYRGHEKRVEVVTWQDDLETLAGFQLDCPIKSLKVVNLGRDGELAGVTGCAQRATYTWLNHSDGWVRSESAFPTR